MKTFQLLLQEENSLGKRRGSHQRATEEGEDDILKMGEESSRYRGWKEEENRRFIRVVIGYKRRKLPYKIMMIMPTSTYNGKTLIVVLHIYIGGGSHDGAATASVVVTERCVDWHASRKKPMRTPVRATMHIIPPAHNVAAGAAAARRRRGAKSAAAAVGPTGTGAGEIFCRNFQRFIPAAAALSLHKHKLHSLDHLHALQPAGNSGQMLEQRRNVGIVQRIDNLRLRRQYFPFLHRTHRAALGPKDLRFDAIVLEHH
nr:hypothetical protein Iba_chr02aCG23330 [Ipomoea batatas]